MRFDVHSISGFIDGVVDVICEDNGAMVPVRFTPLQIQYFSRTESDMIRSYASSGMSFHCETDAEKLILEYSVKPGSSQDIYGFDLYIDGRLCGHSEGSIKNNPEGCISFELEPGKKNVRLFFPNLAILCIRRLELFGETYIKRVSRNRILFLGDSIIQGYTTHFPSMILTTGIDMQLNLSVLNQGLAGLPFEYGTLDKAIGFEPAHIFISLGTNDWNLREKAEFEKEAEMYFRKLRCLWPDVKKTVVTPVWRADSECPVHEGFEHSHVHDVLCGIVKQDKNMRIIDGSKLIPHIPEMFYDKLVHPNEIGFEYYTNGLITEFQRVWEN